MQRLTIVKQSDVSHGTALHFADDWFYGRNALCGKPMRGTARDGEASWKRMCGTCTRIMNKRVEAAHAEALLTQVELDHAEALLCQDNSRCPGAREHAGRCEVLIAGRADLLELGADLGLSEFALLSDTEDLRELVLKAEALEVAKSAGDVADFDEEAVYAQGENATTYTPEETNEMTTPLYVRITEGFEPIEPGDLGVAENETFQFGALGWSGGLQHVDLYRANGERVRFDLEYFKKVALAVDHIGFQPQPRGLENPVLRRVFVQAGKSEVERLREERDAFKNKLMESFVYMTLAADKIETTSVSRADFAEEMRQFVRDGHKL